MEAVAAGFRNRIDNDSSIASVLGVECVGLYLELLDHVDVRLERDLVLHHVAQVDAIEHVIRGIFAGSGRIDSGDPDAAGGSQKRPITGARHDGAGGEEREVEEESSVERDFNDLLVIDDVPKAGGFGLHAAGRRFHGDRRRGFAKLHHRVDASPLAHSQRKRALLERFESGLFGLQCIVSGFDERKFVDAGCVRPGSERHAGIDAGQGHGDVGHRRVLLILYGSHQGRVLRRQRQGQHEE